MSIFPRGEKVPADKFNGNAYLQMLVDGEDSIYNCTVYDVQFEPGCRNNWHFHAAGQILLCTEGVGYYQEKGKPSRRLHPGDVVEIPANTTHWHGAAPDSHFTHIGISPNLNVGSETWLDPLTDEEYADATAK